MPYTRIAALVPANEHFDETAISNEAAWITVGHLNAIESRLQLDDQELITATALTNTVKTERDAHAATITQLQQQVQQLNAEKSTLTGERDALKVKADFYDKQKSGAGSTTIVKKEEAAGAKPVPSYLDDNNPANSWLDKQLRFKNKSQVAEDLAEEEV
ncbi:MAG TPA: hypothetical protein PL045_04385 [Chitinophagaceae bacterium]|nr:hypothetical protein [Chitinophagaceae bacterium]